MHDEPVTFRMQRAVFPRKLASTHSARFSETEQSFSDRVDDNGCTGCAAHTAARPFAGDDASSTCTIPVKKSVGRDGNMASSMSKLKRCVLLAVVTLPTVSALTGCQVEIAGQTLPSAYYLKDDFQYYAEGPEFKLAREAAAMQAQSAATESEAQVR
jgi:hypothetical protein